MQFSTIASVYSIGVAVALTAFSTSLIDRRPEKFDLCVEETAQCLELQNALAMLDVKKIGKRNAYDTRDITRDGVVEPSKVKFFWI
jgi:hypothetical protein